MNCVGGSSGSSPKNCSNPSQTDLISYDKSKPRMILEFKLYKLTNVKLRYDVVYKNLLRDFRRFFCSDFA